MLADRGVSVVVFEQNRRPYGKIEDGLPRWHVKLRQKEYESVNQKLDRPGVHFVPSTRIGADLDFRELATQWGFTAVILAVGAWRDRPLPVEGSDRYVGRGLVYQNAFIHWFNHSNEKGYDGPRHEVCEGALVVGGGLASIDVTKVLQIETVRRALEKRGIREDMLRIEHAGIPAVLKEHGLDYATLGVEPATLAYRRQVEDMPLLEMPEGADEARRQQVGATRRKILEKAMQKYLFRVKAQRAPAGVLAEGDRMVGIRFQHTRTEGSRVVAVDGAFEDLRAPLVVSSIGSIPAPIPGIAEKGEFYDFSDRDLGRIAGYDAVFGAGNAVTGKGNIVVSRKHSIQVGAHLIEEFLGLESGDHAGEEELLDSITRPVDESVARIADWLGQRPPVEPARAREILGRVRARQEAVGYTCSYREWLARVTPPDMV